MTAQMLVCRVGVVQAGARVGHACQGSELVTPHLASPQKTHWNRGESLPPGEH